ncbi:MAG: bifunctional DNA-formamidopyrimidine glycosylase/DNA-(apurinic or apyrimidinic site) lyase [bacterium]|nr:MAG: bifunctional DNA-formamidopyrimidine glycosylase/DNA-(apurinic or apyrimidinic site) lyase [bacterium]
MPELPEVETMRMQLEKFLVGSLISKVQVKTPSYDLPIAKLVRGRVLGVRRFAKVTSIDLDNGYSILTHVKLTGQFVYKGPKLDESPISKKVVGGVPGPHTHVIFEFSDGGKLYYNDIRKFGWVKIEKTTEVENEKFVKALGPEPFGSVYGKPSLLTFDYFSNLLSKSKRNIKVLLMDQSKIGGVGNIYANDALWLSKISPKRASNSLSNKDSKLLFNAIETVLKNGLKYGGASELAFVTPDGKEGEYQNHTLVYNHQGEVCSRCKTEKIEKFFLGGRGTYWCKKCQK